MGMQQRSPWPASSCRQQGQQGQHRQRWGQRRAQAVLLEPWRRGEGGGLAALSGTVRC